MNQITNRKYLWVYLAIIFLVFAYYYFFTEQLPWFWYDDVQRIEAVENISTIDILKEVFNFRLENFGIERPTLSLFIKMYTFLFGEDPHRIRLFKIIIFSFILCMMFFLTIRHGGNLFITLSCLFVFATFPSVFIVNAWINESATLELLFKVCSFIVFFC